MRETTQDLTEKEACLASFECLSDVIRHTTHRIGDQYENSFLIAAEHTISDIDPKTLQFRDQSRAMAIKYFLPLETYSVEKSLQTIFHYHGLITQNTGKRIETRAYYLPPHNTPEIPEQKNLLHITSDTLQDEDHIIQIWTNQHHRLALKLNHR